jgi:predicted kinase
MPTMYVLVGMIASGKSTFSLRLAEQGALVINDDAFTSALHGGDYSGYDRKLRPVYKAMLNHGIRLGLLAGRDVLVDSTNLSVRTRKKLIELARECDARCVAVTFEVMSPEVHARRRFRADNRGASAEQWLAVAQAHFAEYVPVSISEGFDAITEGAFA